MNDVLSAMLEKLTEEEKTHAITILEAKLEPSLIKQRQSGYGKALDYIEGHTVIHILNKAFGYKWSFEVVSEAVQPALDKDGRTTGNVVKVLGRLTIPGMGVKEQYGSQVLNGAVTVQEGAWKSAATDALKKCATLVGVGRELYMDDAVESATTTASRSADNVSHLQKRIDAVPANELKVEYVDQLKSLKQTLGITDNNALNDYVSRATQNKLQSYKDINNTNVKLIIKLMEEDVAVGH